MQHKLSKYFLLVINHLKFKNSPSFVESTNNSDQTQGPGRKTQTFCILKISRYSYDSGFFQSKFTITQLFCLKVHCTEDYGFHNRKFLFKIQRQNSVAETSSTQNSNKIVITGIKSCPRTFQVCEFKFMPEYLSLVKLHYSYCRNCNVNFSPFLTLRFLA